MAKYFISKDNYEKKIIIAHFHNNTILLDNNYGFKIEANLSINKKPFENSKGFLFYSSVLLLQEIKVRFEVQNPHPYLAYCNHKANDIL